MAKRDRRRDARRQRRVRELAAAWARHQAAEPIQRRNLTYRSRGVEFSVALDPEPVQGHGGALTPDEARARLLERAIGGAPADG